MFHFSRCPPSQLSLSGNPSSMDWVSPFGDLRIKGCLSPPRSLSQIAASFIGSQCLGIHHTPLILQPLKHQCSIDWCRSVSSWLLCDVYIVAVHRVASANCQSSSGPRKSALRSRGSADRIPYCFRAGVGILSVR